MSNPVLSAIGSHRSIRKYQKKEVPREILEEILSTAMQASTSGNMQAYSVIVTTDEKLKNELYPLHFKQEMVLEAPAFLTFCADFNRMRLWLEENEAPPNFDNLMSFLIGMIDATLYSQNVALAAESMGLGVCYLGTTLANNNKIAKVLKLPSQVVPVVGFSLGYPDEDIQQRDRLPLEAILHDQVYQNYCSKQLKAYHAGKEQASFKRYLDDEQLRQKLLTHEANNLAQIYTKIKYTRQSHLSYSSNVLRCLHEQGFMNHEP